MSDRKTPPSHQLVSAVDLGLPPSWKAHAPGYCTECGAWSLVAVSKATATGRGNSRPSWPHCRITPGCEGRHVPLERDIEAGNDKRWGVPAPYTRPSPPTHSDTWCDEGGRWWREDADGKRRMIPPPT